MLKEVIKTFVYVAVVLSLYTIDNAFGHGFLEAFKKAFCKIVCFLRKSVREEASKAAQMAGIGAPISLPALLMEVLILSLSMAFLNKFKQHRGKDRIDELLQESKEALRQTNEFLEKWRLRRINWQIPTEYSYLDEEPQEIKPFKFKTPIMHMAIIDTRGQTRNQPERGDAGDTIHITDSMLLSVTSLLEDDLESIPEPIPEDNIIDEVKSNEYKNRFELWDVEEEDANNLED